jgi:hypothetical protein
MLQLGVEQEALHVSMHKTSGNGLIGKDILSTGAPLNLLDVHCSRSFLVGNCVVQTSFTLTIFNTVHFVFWVDLLRSPCSGDHLKAASQPFLSTGHDNSTGSEDNTHGDCHNLTVIWLWP